LGGLAAGIGTYGLQQYGQFMRRQAGEAQTPEQLAPGKAAAAAALTAPLGYIADRFTLGIGNIPKKVLGEELAAELARRTGGSLAARVGTGATMGVIAEAPTEVLEQAAERWQAGLPLDNADAKREYLEAAAGAAVIGGIGGGAYGALRGSPPEKLSPLTGEIPTQLETSVQSVMPDLTPAQSRSGLTMDQASDLRQEAAMAEQERQAALQQRQLADQQAQQERVAQAQERARAMPGMTGAPDANAVMMERVRENEIAQQKAQEQDKKNKIKEVMNTTFYADPIMNKMAKDRALTELGQTVQPLVKPKRDAALEWASMSPEEQQEALLSAEPPVKKSQLQDPKNEPRRVKDFSKSELIQMGVEVPEEVAKEKPQYKATEHPLNMGVDNKLIAQGARPYTYKIQAQEAAKKQPDMKVVKSGLGYVLSPKTAGELAVQKKSTIGNFQTGTPNLPYSAHEFIVSRGGLKPSHRSDMGFQDENPIVGNRYLFSGRGVSLDEAGIQLEQAGYLPKNQLHTENDVINLLTGSIKDPQYSSEGLEYISQMEQARSAKDYDLAEAKETLYAPMEDEFDYYYENDIYRLDIPDLVNMADKLDVDVEGIVMEVVSRLPNSTQEEATVAVHDALSAALKEKIGSRQETLQSTTDKPLGIGNIPKFKPKAEQEKFQKELLGKDFMQASQWLITNAPNNFAKFVAQKTHKMLKDLERKGVQFNFEIQAGKERDKKLFNADGVTHLIWGKEGTKINVLINGLPVFENQLGYPSGLDYVTLQHEFLHAAMRTSTRFLPNDHPVKKELRDLFNKVVTHYNEQRKTGTLPPVMDRYNRSLNNSLASTDELLSWGLTDRDFQEYLNTIKVGEKTVMQKIVELVRQLLGMNKSYESALDRLVKTSESLLDIDLEVLRDQMTKESASFGPNKTKALGSQQSLFSKAAGRLMNDELEKISDIGAKVKGKAQQVLQNRAPADMTVFNGMSPDTIQNVNGLFFAPNKTVIDRLDDLKGNFWNTVAQKTVDQFRSIRDVSREGYMQARLSTSIDGALEGLLFYGHVFNDGGALNVKTEKNGQKLKGMIEAMKPLGKDVDRFQTWMAVSREANLPADRRSTDPRMQALVNSRDEFTSGTVNGKPRMEVYEQVRKDLMALNRSVLTVAKDAGLIDKFAYDRFMADGFYIPFYKAMEDGKIESIRAASRITNQQFSKELSNKGEKPFGDLMENTLRNWSHILSASMKNQAAVTIVRDASGIDAVQPSLKVGLEWRDGKVYSVQSGDVVGNGDLVQNIVDKNGQQREVSLTEAGKGTVSVQIDGLATHWHVIDPMLLESIGAITYLGPQSKVIDVMRGFKNVLRAGVTISPGFKVANLIKDSIQSIGVAGGAGEKGGLGFNAVNNILKGWASSKPGSPVYISALAGGGIFNYGSTLEGDRSKVIKKLIKQGVNSENIWDSEEKIKTGLSRLWKSYEDLGNRTESVNRALLYKNLVAQNYSHLEASFHARDLLDFSMQGSSSAVRFLSQVVPFANARLQGLYKLGRDGIIPTARVFYNSLTGKDSNLTDKQKAKAFSAVAMTTAMASMLLYLTFKDDEEFKKREQWDRDLFWWFKLPGMDFAIRIPKPFEFGAIATLAERSLEQMIDDTVESKRFTDSLSRTLFQTFSMNPMPQMFKPLYDVSTNKDAFTSAPIETAGMERLSKQERKTDMTSPLAKALGGLSHILTPESLKESEISPVQADYLIRSYFGWLGGTIETASQYAVMPFNNGVYPDADWTKRMSLGFVAKLPTQQSTYVTDFYQNNQLISQAYADMRHYAELGQAEKVQEILTEKGDLIGLEKLYDKTSKNLANIRKQVLMIQNPENTSMTGEQKKEEIDRLKQLISMISEQAESIRKSMKK
jgi:hypothetical protein